MFLHTQILL